ncbi:Mucin-associated surface protein (MASP) [Trypanosoma cruzi]|nr:Mucin-associated surface protein (MASP) [Trypanosoma cruzi]
MAMMMTGRVLLVCALCVLWCGAGWVYAREFENNAVGGCMASGVLGMRTLYLSSGCNKTTPTLPLRSAFFIDAIQAEERELKDISQESNSLGSVSIPPPPPLPAPETLEAPPPLGASVSEASGRSEVGPASQADGDGGGGGSSRISHGDKHPILKVSGLVDKSTSSTTNDGDGLKNTDVESATQKDNSSGTDEQAGKALDLPILPTVQNPEVLHSDKNKIPPNTQEATNVEARDNGASEGRTGESDVHAKDSSSVSSAKSKPTGKPSLPVQPTGQSPPTAAGDTRNSTQTNEKTTTSGIGTDSEAPKPYSKNDVAEQYDEDRDPSDLIRGANTGHPTDTASSPISTSGNGDFQGMANENGDNPERHNPRETHDDPEVGNVNVGPKASQPAPETVKTVTAQTNDTVKPGDSDGSTAASHTTSPLLLLLLLVACAAAAAVVAA